MQEGRGKGWDLPFGAGWIPRVGYRAVRALPETLVNLKAAGLRAQAGPSRTSEAAVEACVAPAASLTGRRGRRGLGAARRLGSAPDRRTDCGSGAAFRAGFERRFLRRSACSRR